VFKIPEPIKEWVDLFNALWLLGTLVTSGIVVTIVHYFWQGTPPWALGLYALGILLIGVIVIDLRERKKIAKLPHIEKPVSSVTASLPSCPLEVVFDPSNEIYRRWQEEDHPLGHMFDKQRRKTWYFEIWNEPPSQDITNVSVCLDSMETILGKPGGMGPGIKHFGAKLGYENGSTEKSFPPGHREKIALCSSIIGSDRIRIEGTDIVFQYSGGSHKLRVVITCSGRSPEERTFRVWIDDAGALQADLEPLPASLIALKKVLKSFPS